MEAKDLMINDLVSVSGTPMRIACIGTTKVGFYDEKGGIFFHLYEEVKPIPTTDEFLEKNGWEKDVQGEMMYMRPQNLSCEVVKRDKWNESVYKIGNIDVVIDDNGYARSEPLFYAIADVSEVHKFQHALKVLGIEQEVNV